MIRKGLLLLFMGPLAACGDDGTESSFPLRDCSDPEITSATCVEIKGGDANALLTATNSLTPDTTIVLGKGTFAMTNEVSIQNVADVHILGQGIGETVLDWAGVSAQVNGIAALNTNGFLVQDFTVKNSVKDGIRVEASDRVTYRRIEATWDTPLASTNGAYGIYPVKSKHVLVEDSLASNASDAGLYVGQCQYAIVRRNEVFGNVAGLEIENTQYADVYGNLAENNTAGIVVFDLPGNPVVGRDVRLRDNQIINNNHPNFAPGGTVAIIPAGTGTFAMASRRVEITGNTYMNNGTGDIAILSGLVVDSDPAVWEIANDAVIGDVDDLGLLPGATANTTTNFRTENILIANNTHSGSGMSADTDMDFGALVQILYFPVGGTPSIIYDTIGESMFDAEVAANNSNDNRICAGGNTNGTGFGSMHVEAQLVSAGSPHLVIEDAPFAPFDCTELEGGPVEEVVLP